MRETLTEDQENAIIAAPFRTTDGQAALVLLSRMYSERPDYVRGDPYHSAFRSGQRDVVEFIKQVLKSVEEAADV